MSEDEDEYRLGLETVFLIYLLDCSPSVRRCDVQRMDRPLVRFLKGLLEVVLHDLPDTGSYVGGPQPKAANRSLRRVA